MHLAALSGFLDTIQALLDGGAHTEATDYDNQTPLHKAAKKGHVDAVKALLSVGCDTEVRASTGETPADVASHPEVKALLSPRAVYEACALGSCPSPNLLQQLLAYPSTRSARVKYVGEFQSTSLHLDSPVFLRHAS